MLHTISETAFSVEPLMHDGLHDGRKGRVRLGGERTALKGPAHTPWSSLHADERVYHHIVRL